MGLHWDDADRHEDKLNLGVADVSFCLGGRHGWMELKQLDAWPVRDATPVRMPHFTAEQRLWLRRKGIAAGNTWLLMNVRDARGEWLLFPWDRLDDVGRGTRALHYAAASWRSPGGLHGAELAAHILRSYP
jgi:hypothetical protein